MKSFIYFRLLSKHHDSQQLLLSMGRPPDNSDQCSDELFTWCSLVCHDVYIAASKLVLSASFSSNLCSNKEVPTCDISLPDTNHDHLNSLLGFLHTGQLKSSKVGAPFVFSKIAFWYRKLDLLLLSEHSWLKIISFRSLFLYEWFRIWTATTWSES